MNDKIIREPINSNWNSVDCVRWTSAVLGRRGHDVTDMIDGWAELERRQSCTVVSWSVIDG